MTERQKDCILEIQELLLAINETVSKYDLKEDFIACLAVGFLDMETMFKDEDGNERANMSLLSSFSVTDEEELDDLLSYCVEAFRQDKKEDIPPEGNTADIEYWIRLANGDDSVN
jgi:hypothetical protein